MTAARRKKRKSLSNSLPGRVTIIGIATDTLPPSFIQQMGITYPLATADDKVITDHGNIPCIPTSYRDENSHDCFILIDFSVSFIIITDNIIVPINRYASRRRIWVESKTGNGTTLYFTILDRDENDS